MKTVPIHAVLRRAEMPSCLIPIKRDESLMDSFFCDFDLLAPDIYLETQKRSYTKPTSPPPLNCESVRFHSHPDRMVVE